MSARILFALSLLFTTSSFASSGIGLSVGAGIPFLGQAGINYKASDQLNFYVGYNTLSVDSGSAKAELTMPEIGLTYHPFSGSFFLGASVGQESLEVTATDDFTNQEVKAEVDAMTAIAKVGWMWGASNGGFWFGIDLAYVSPLNAETTITAPGVPITDQDYIDTREAAERFGESAYINLTFARLGYIF